MVFMCGSLSDRAHANLFSERRSWILNEEEIFLLTLSTKFRIILGNGFVYVCARLAVQSLFHAFEQSICYARIICETEDEKVSLIEPSGRTDIELYESLKRKLNWENCFSFSSSDLSGLEAFPTKIDFTLDANNFLSLAFGRKRKSIFSSFKTHKILLDTSAL